jgi:hypothetical protein
MAVKGEMIVRGLRNILVVGSVAGCVALSSAALAGPALKFSSDTGAGSVISFDWDGGDAGGFGAAGTLQAAMNYAATKGGGTNFDNAGFKAHQVNMFLVDFSADADFGDAGVTLFVMWGNTKDPGGSFAGEVDVSPLIDEGSDGSFTAGLSEIFALGAGVDVEVGGVSVDVDVENDETPIGYAITNVLDYPGGIVNESFTLAGVIAKLRLLGFGQGKVWQGTDTDGDEEIFTDSISLSIIPAPPAAIWGLAGLAGVAIAGRRRFVKA